MANMVHAFKDRDVRRAIKAARAEGLNPTAIEIDVKTGRIKVMGGKPAADMASADNEWDQVYDNGAAETATVR